MTKLPSENEVTGKAAEVYADIKAHFGTIPNFFKAQAAIDPEWLNLNWQRTKHVMLSSGGLDRKTRELIAFVVSEVNRCAYCSPAHETMALMNGATEQEINQAKQIIELFCSFNAIAETLDIPCDISPDMLKKHH
jgi:uncharacterized peroxidase-related enzyme